MPSTLIFLLAKLLLVGWLCVVPVRGQRPGQVDPLTLNRADPQCWESSSGRLLDMRTPRIADTVPAFWNLMVFLKASDNRKHSALYWDLAQVFWDTYVDCVLSRTHGLGRRHSPWPREQITAVRSLISDKSIVEDSKTNSSKLKEFSQRLLRVQVQRIDSGILNHILTHSKDQKKRSQI